MELYLNEKNLTEMGKMTEFKDLHKCFSNMAEINSKNICCKGQGNKFEHY